MLERIKNLLNQKEKSDLEFKRATFQVPNDVYQTVCAFLNTDGGEILLGVNNDGVIEGVIESEVDKMKSDFITTLNGGTKIAPSVICDIKSVEVENKIILYIQVDKSSTVHRCDGKIFVRKDSFDLDKTNDNNVVANLYLNKSSIYSENKIYPAVTYEDLREDIIDRAKTIALNRNPNHIWRDWDYKTILAKTSLYHKDFSTGEEGYTLAAVLLFGTDDLIRSVLPSYKIDLVKRVDNPLRYDDRVDLRTNLIDSYDIILDFVNKYLPNPFYLENNSRINLRDIIFREIISNILVHKEYLRGEPTRLIIERNKIITENSNRPHSKGLINIEKLSPYPKNPNISRIFRQLGRVEELGSGVENLLKYSQKYFGSVPEIEDDDVFKLSVKHNFFPVAMIKKSRVKKGAKAVQMQLLDGYDCTPQANPDTPQAVVCTPQANTDAPQADEFTHRVVNYCKEAKTLNEIMQHMKYKDRKNFKQKLDRLVNLKLIKMTLPDKPTSPNQKYVSI